MEKSTILVNEKYKVYGTFAVESHSQMIPDPESATGKRQQITIEGKLSCEEYFPILHDLESDRYKVSGIFVTTEGFVSNTDMIDYLFTADNFIVKIGDPHGREK